MRKVPVIRVAALTALAILAAGCGTTASTQSSPGATPSASPSSTVAGSAPTTPGRSATASAPTTGAPTGVAATCAGAGTVHVQSSGVSAAVPALDTVQLVSSSAGWAAGAGRIVSTSNGGATWTSQYAGPDQIFQLDFTDASHGWAVGTSALLATSNGGRTWTPLTEPCGLIDSVHFVTPLVGYAVSGGPQVTLSAGIPVATGQNSSGGGKLLVTTDGGRTWNAVTAAPSAAESACFTSQSDGYLGTPGKVWRTTDAGAHWSASFTEPPASNGAPADTTALECAGPSAAWTLFLGSGAAMSHSPYIAYATQDGQNWKVLFEETYTESAVRPNVKAPDGPGSYPGPFSAIGPGSAVYVGWTPPLGLGAAPLYAVALGSGGATLTKDGNVGGLTEPYAAAFLTPARGWVVGMDQTTPAHAGSDVIQYTANSGHTWTRQYTAP